MRADCSFTGGRDHLSVLIMTGNSHILIMILQTFVRSFQKSRGNKVKKDRSFYNYRMNYLVIGLFLYFVRSLSYLCL